MHITSNGLLYSNKHNCAYCKQLHPKFHCGGCIVTKYCTKECQVKHWKSQHKKECKIVQKSIATNKIESIQIPKHSIKYHELLTFGFIHESYNHKSFIMNEIIELIIKFYDQYFQWNFHGKDLNNFFQAKNGHLLRTESSFKINDIEFGCILAPNGLSMDNIGFVFYFIELKYLPSNIEYITIYIELHCEQTNTSLKGIAKWNSIPAETGWNLVSLKLNECNNYKHINFRCLVRIRGIKFKENKFEINSDNYYIKPVRMSNYFEYIWIINKFIINKMVNMRVGEVIQSNNFDNNNWCLDITPNGIDYNCEGNIGIYLKLLAIPVNISCFEVEIDFKGCNGTMLGKNNHMETSKIVSAYDYSHGLNLSGLHVSDLANMETLSILVQLSIINVWDDKNSIIHYTNWRKYGVV